MMNRCDNVILNNMDSNTIDQVIIKFYNLYPQGGNFFDFTHTMFDDNSDEDEELLVFLEEHDILEEHGSAHNYYRMSYSFKQDWEEFGSIVKYLDSIKELEKDEKELIKAGNEKTLNDSKLSKWQVKTFWPVLIFGFIGGVCGFVSLILDLRK